jgi:hypothetical protein
MQVRNYKIMHCSQDSFEAALNEIAENPMAPDAPEGFALTSHEDNRLTGIYTYPRTKKVKRLDEKGELEIVGVVDIQRCRFCLNQRKGLAYVEGARGHFPVLYERLDEAQDVRITFEDYHLDLAEIYHEFAGNFPKHRVKSLKIKDYLAKENMIGTPTFQVLEPAEAFTLVERFKDKLQAFSLAIKMPDGTVSLKIDKRGTVWASDDAPEELLMYAQDSVVRYHEEEIETVLVGAPNRGEQVQQRPVQQPNPANWTR